MRKPIKSQSGFGVIEGILILVIVVAIAGIGYYVYKAKNNTDSTYNSAASVSATTKTTTPPPAAPEAQYLKIKEFGIELPLTSDISDLSYPAPTAFNGNYYAVQIQSSSKLGDLYHQIDSACDTVGQPQPVGAKILSTSAPANGQQTSATTTVKGTKYYLYARGGVAGCDPSGDFKPTTAQQAQIAAYFSAVSTAVTNAKAL